jgi:coenzyme F420 hydrogenase subunit beta
MRSFENLIQEVQNAGLCHRCGGCVNFCTAINYGALEQDPTGLPRFSDREKCLECGICYMICPETRELEGELEQRFHWRLPAGPILEVAAARGTDPEVLKKASDGGAITSLLMALLDSGSIDGALVSMPTGPFTREPYLATTKREILESAGLSLQVSHGMQHFSRLYSSETDTFPELRPLLRRRLRKVAYVGTPRQIKSVRKMEYLGLVPADRIRYCFGLFCFGNYGIGPTERSYLERMGAFHWEEVERINIKGEMQIHLTSGKTVRFPLQDLKFMKGYACRFCPDLSAEFADISFSGLGAGTGWTSLVIRTPKGQLAINQSAAAGWLELLGDDESPGMENTILTAIEDHAERKRAEATRHRKKLGQGVGGA